MSEPYEKRRFTPFEFINHAKIYSEYFICYLEALIDPRGGIYLAVPSHEKRLLEIVKDQYDFDYTLEITDKSVNPASYAAQKYGFIYVWYNSLLVPSSTIYDNYEIDNYYKNMTKQQLRTIKILKNSKLINPDALCFNNEYYLYQYRENYLKGGTDNEIIGINSRATIH